MSYQVLHRLLAIIFLVICALIVVYTRELGNLRGYIGDIVVIMFLYSTIQGIVRIPSAYLILGILVLAFVIEGLQYLEFLSFIGGAESITLNLIFGSVFDTLDLLAYTLGGLLIYTLDRYHIVPKFSRP